jgi:hypothetical protein
VVVDHRRQDLTQAADRVASGALREPLLAGIVDLLEFDVAADVDDGARPTDSGLDPC